MGDVSQLFGKLQGGDSKLITAHLPCSSCDSSDALCEYSDHTYCFACKTYKWINEVQQVEPQMEITNADISFTQGEIGPIRDRGISKETAKFYGVSCIRDNKGEIIKHIYPYYKAGKKVAQKIRIVATKDFYSEGNIKNTELFGQQLFPASNRPYIILTEGELDAMAAYQLSGKIYPCLSIANGATSAEKIVKDNLEYLNAFKCIVICFDNDENGQAAAVKVARLFPADKCKIFKTNPQYKDACDYLQAGKAKEFVETLYNSPTYTPAGIIDLYDLHDKFLERKAKLVRSPLTYPWEGLNDLTYGIRPGEFIVVTAETGIGKTSFLREIQNHLLNTSTVKTGAMYIEEQAADTYGRTLGLELKSPLHLPTVDVNVTELQAAREKIGKGRVYVYEHFGSNDIEDILDRIRYFKTSLGCQMIILDHISMLVSDQRYEDERRALDAISTKLKQLTVELDINIHAIVHLNRQGEIRGSAAIEQLADGVIRLTRDLVAEDSEERNQMKVVVSKNRFSGKTGPCCTLNFNPSLNRLVEHDFQT